MEWDYSGRKGRDGQKRKLVKPMKEREKLKGEEMSKYMDKGERGVPRPHTGRRRAESFTPSSCEQ